MSVAGSAGMISPLMAAEDPTPIPAVAARRVVVVLGMHRSGTSAVAGCLQRLGVDLGPRLMPATADNPRGYYEHVDVVNFHDRFLLALGRSWDETGPFPPGGWQDGEAANRYQAEMLALLRRDFATAPLWGLKDPRLCRLLPWWEPMWSKMDSEPLFVLVRRPPSDVAASLARREGFSAGKSHLLWLQHTLEAERFTRGKPRVLVDFTAFLADWRAALEPAAALLGRPWPVSPPVDDPADGGFVDPSLAHATAGTALPLWVEEADAALRQGLTGQEGEMRAGLDRITGHLRAAEALYAPAPAETTADLRHQLDDSRRQAAWYEAEWQKARARAEDAHAKLLAKRQENERLRRAILHK